MAYLDKDFLFLEKKRTADVEAARSQASTTAVSHFCLYEQFSRFLMDHYEGGWEASARCVMSQFDKAPAMSFDEFWAAVEKAHDEDAHDLPADHPRRVACSVPEEIVMNCAPAHSSDIWALIGGSAAAKKERLGRLFPFYSSLTSSSPSPRSCVSQ